MEDGGAILSGDGMVSAVRFAGGKVGFAIRYVQTERHKAEVAAGRALFGKYRNPYTDSLKRRAWTARSPTPPPSGTPGDC